MENIENQDEKVAELENIQSKYQLQLAKNIKEIEDLMNKRVPAACMPFRLNGINLGLIMQSLGWKEVPDNEAQ